MYSSFVFVRLLTALAVMTSSMVYGHGSGAPVSACDTMSVSHHNSSDSDKPIDPQANDVPYSIFLDSNTVDAGGNITVTFQSSGDGNFQGLLLKAIPSVNGQPKQMDIACGTFQIDDSLFQTIACSDTTDSAITHTSSDPKTNVTVTWIAPQVTSTSTFLFIVAVAETHDVFWNAIYFPEEVKVVAPDNGGQAALDVNHFALFILAIMAIVMRF